ncbi:MAG TPA: ribokinase [Actinomycetota bacterium]|nr:ribokinase [Actinomycetota bacterium]
MSATVVVVGSVNVDLVTYVDRLPRPGETVVGGTFARAHGGKGANQAVAAARLGARAVLVGMVGDDDLGAAARAELAREGVDVDAVGESSRHTGVAQILVDRAGENLIAVASGANDDLTTERVEAALARVDAPHAVVLSVLEVPDDAVAAAARAAGARGWPFVLNPAPARAVAREVLASCAVVTPNEHELAGLGGGSADELLGAGAGAVVVTRGAAGAELVRVGRAVHRQAAFEARPVDTTGAGDAFSGALAWALAEGRDLEHAVELAAAAGALATQKEGARGGMPARAELEAFVARRAPAEGE